MKRLGLLFAAVMLVGILGAAGCGKQEEEIGNEGYVGIANPMVSYESAEAVEKQSGIKLVIPAKATDANYFIISNQISECQFYIGEVKYNLRASKELDDFMGVYDELRSADIALDIDGEIEDVGIFVNGGCYAKWKKGNVRYTLATTDSAANIEEFYNLVYDCAGRK